MIFGEENFRASTLLSDSDLRVKFQLSSNLLLYWPFNYFFIRVTWFRAWHFHPQNKFCNRNLASNLSACSFRILRMTQLILVPRVQDTYAPNWNIFNMNNVISVTFLIWTLKSKKKGPIDKGRKQVKIGSSAPKSQVATHSFWRYLYGMLEDLITL